MVATCQQLRFFPFASLQSRCCKFTNISDLSVRISSTKLPSLARKRISFEKCGTQTPKPVWFDTRSVSLEHFLVLSILTSQHVRRLISTVTLQKSIAHPNQNLSLASVLSPSFTQTANAQRTKRIGDQEVDVTQLVAEVDDESLKEELETFKHFPIDSEMENRRHRVFSFAWDVFHGQSLSQKQDTVFEKLKCAA